jgi:hypothetical protein|tara:strand:+ start:1411 stop:1875 length:465 start_codon:yes stop_codon:yes gene_type:complete
MNDTIKILDNSDFSVQKDATSTAEQVVKDAPSTEILESGKPKLSKDDKAAKKLFEAVQLAYDNLITLNIQGDVGLGRKHARGNISQELSDKIESAHEEYDDLVDMVVEITKGNAPCTYTDPQTVDLFEIAGYRVVRSMTYNDMAELQGSLAFGE